MDAGHEDEQPAALTQGVSEILATYRVTTPLFGGGADLVSSPSEIRGPSFKGVLRWWWRALAWSHYKGQIAKVKAAEDRVFGSASGGSGTGRSRVLLRILPDGELQTLSAGKTLRDENNDVVGPGARYLGYGVVEAVASRKRNTVEGELLRPCIVPSANGTYAKFRARLRLRDLTSDDVELLKNALVALGTMGGMGARSRRGFGSLSLEKLTVSNGAEGDESYVNPSNPTELAIAIGLLIPDVAARDRRRSLPPYTALSPNSRFVVYDGETIDALGLLNEVGEEMMLYRSWGRNGQVLGKPREKDFRFEDDHDLMARVAGGSRESGYPERTLFGLPHNYYFSSISKKAEVAPAKPGLDRRASPLLIHIHAFEDTYAAVVTVIPAQFLPGNGNGKVKLRPSGTEAVIKGGLTPYEPLLGFLKRLDTNVRPFDLGGDAQ